LFLEPEEKNSNLFQVEIFFFLPENFRGIYEGDPLDSPLSDIFINIIWFIASGRCLHGGAEARYAGAQKE
jgi:hypothetical protein